MMVQRISRTEELALPVFNNHIEAVEYFRNRYGDAFVLDAEGAADGETIYFYVLILDKAEWTKGKQHMQDHGYISGTDFLQSFQSIQISATGTIHIDY